MPLSRREIENVLRTEVERAILSGEEARNGSGDARTSAHAQLAIALKRFTDYTLHSILPEDFINQD